MKIAVSGSGGFVGSHIRRECSSRGWAFQPLSRGLLSDGNKLGSSLEGADAIVNLAGASIMAKWTDRYKLTMYSSRIVTTRNIVDACSSLATRPKVLVSASAVGIYSHGGPHTEASNTQAGGFLGGLARDWEAEALRASDLGLRVVIFRLGVVLGPDGGALKKMLTPFRMGLGGTIGDGSQPFSWVHIEDLKRAFIRAIEDTGMQGAYNLSAPNPTTNRGLTKALATVLGKPAFMRVPALTLRLQFGEGARMLTTGQHVLPERLQSEGFAFRHENITDALRDLLA
jgi:uncharacterized protein (TIGR01777 family)